jgi:AraC-like DNA-binding protein
MLDFFKTFSIIATIYACLFWAVAMFIPAIKRYGARLFVFFIFLFSTFVFIMMYAKIHQHFDFYSSYLPIHGFFTFSLFPLFFLYVYTLTKSTSSFNKKHLWHFLFPLIYAVLVYFVLHVWMDKQERYFFVSEAVGGHILPGLRFQFAFYTYRIGKMIYVILSIVYVIYIYKIYKRHMKRSAELFSNEESANIKWIRTLAVLFVVLFMAHLAIQIPGDAFVAENKLLVGGSYLSFAVFYFTLGYYSFQQKQLYLPFSEQYDKEQTRTKVLKKRNIIEYFSLNKPYLDPDFSLYDMCAFFDTNRTYLSSLINQQFGMNFRSLVNTYRLEEAKTLLLKSRLASQPVSLEYITYKSGFNSYATFARFFKQSEGISPCDYREKIANSSHKS